MATSSLFSIQPRVHRRWPTAARCDALPSCIKCHITPLFRVPWRPPGASAPISAGTLRFAHCRVTFPRTDHWRPLKAAASDRFSQQALELTARLNVDTALLKGVELMGLRA